MRLPVVFGTMTTIAILFTSLTASNNNANTAPSQMARISNSDRLTQNYQQQADNLLTAGNQEFGTRDYAEAITDFSRVIQIKPNFGKAVYNRRVSYTLSSNKQSTIDNYDQAIQLDPQNLASYFNCSVARDKIGDWQGALSDLDRIIIINHSCLETYLNRGFAKANLDDNRGAIADYDLAIKVNPNYYLTYHHRAAARQALKDRSGAVRNFQITAKLYQQQDNKRESNNTLNLIW